MSIKITKEVNRIATTEISILEGGAFGLENSPFENSEGSVFIPGNELEVHLGYGDNKDLIYAGIILSQGLVVKRDDSLLVVACADKSVRLTKGRHSGVYSKATDSDVFKKIVGLYGLAHAYAQGTDIHVASGQEKHLPHETWHVVQQAQGRVKPTIQLEQGIPVNDDADLEHEADVMGARALQMKNDDNLANTTGALAIAQRKLKEIVQSKSIVVQRYEISGAEGQHPEGSVTASKSEIFRWLNGEKMWSQVNTEWCLIGGSAHVEIVEHLLSSNSDGVVTALVAAMGIVPQTDIETTQEYIDFFVHEVMTTEDLDIAVSNRDVAEEFPANQAEAKRLLCPEYSKQGVDLLIDATAERFKLPNGVWVVAPESLTGKPKRGRAGLLAAIGAKKSKNEQLDGKGRKRTARNELMNSVLEQGLLEKP